MTCFYNKCNSITSKMSSGRKRSLSGPAGSSTPDSKRKRYLCSYQKSWETQFNWIKPSNRGPHDAYCTLCKSHLSIGSGAKNDLSRHAKSHNHVQLELLQKNSKSISSFVTPTANSLTDKITNADVLIIYF